MNFGFNSNVNVGSTTYHVQTEDRGPSHPFLDTVVYLAGQVVYKRSTSYKDFATAWNLRESIRILRAWDRPSVSSAQQARSMER